jgi:drug/metabolite transporter (DMT)-like permease
LVLLALVLYLISTIAWIQALRTIPLSIAFMFNALAFIIVPFAGFILFGEQMPRYFLPSAAMIIGGIILVSMG